MNLLIQFGFILGTIRSRSGSRYFRLRSRHKKSMEKQIDKKFTWVIRNFASLPSNQIYSEKFVVGGCRWRVRAFPKGYKNANHFPLFLAVADSESLPLGWRRRAIFSLAIVNQFSDKLSQVKETLHWFDQRSPEWGFSDMITLAKLKAGEGFMVNGKVIVAVKFYVLEVEGKLDVSDKSSLRHVDIVSKFRPTNPYLKTGYMNVLLSLTESLCQSPKDISKDDLTDKYAALAYLKEGGFELGWLEKKLDEIKEKKEKEEACLARLQEMKDQLQPLKRKYTELKAEIKMVEAELLGARAPDLSLCGDSVV